MRIGVAGAGAVGCHYGGMMQQAGQEVVYLARGEHLLAMRQKGLLHISNGKAYHHDVQASDDAGILADCDVILLTSKMTVLEEMCLQIASAVKPDALLMTMQNGVLAPDQVAHHFPSNPLIAASAFIGARIEKPGVVIHSAAGHLRMGWWQKRDEPHLPELNTLLTAWRASGVDAQEVEDMKTMLWNKLLWNCGFNAITALTRRFAKDIAAEEDSVRWVRDAMQETIAVAAGCGVTLEADAIEQHIALTMKAGEVKTSMWQDLEHHRPTEIAVMNGYIASKAKELGLNTPVNDILASMIRAAEREL
ncbi:MAG TPA: 2-dehydropantoate 2-reductase [Mariprofundaceae bacterium]|nr:2-dehydropantoate 2-reductase [Mariprofundaceae bacterium]